MHVELHLGCSRKFERLDRSRSCSTACLQSSGNPLSRQTALFNPKTNIPNTQNHYSVTTKFCLISEPPGVSKNMFLHRGDTLGN